MRRRHQESLFFSGLESTKNNILEIEVNLEADWLYDFLFAHNLTHLTEAIKFFSQRKSLKA